MRETNFGELEKQAREARDHTDKTIELFDKAHKLETEAAAVEAASANQRRELIDKVRQINRKAIAEARKGVKIEMNYC